LLTKELEAERLGPAALWNPDEFLAAFVDDPSLPSLGEGDVLHRLTVSAAKLLPEVLAALHLDKLHAIISDGKQIAGSPDMPAGADDPPVPLEPPGYVDLGGIPFAGCVQRLVPRPAPLRA
jgi:hypothetical protein